MRRSIYVSLFIVLSAAAGFLYYNHTRIDTAIVATRDLPVGTRIADGDIALRSINPASVSGQVLHSADQAVGQLVSSEVFRDQLIDARQLAPMKNASLLASGVAMPPGSRIIGLPVTPSAAVGGVLKAGDLVDVLAIPNPTKPAALADEPVPLPVVLGKDVLVIGLRTDQGTAVDEQDHGLNIGTSKAATVLLAIAPSDETTYSAAIGSSTFVLTLSTE